jgi:hypothetical protein
VNCECHSLNFECACAKVVTLKDIKLKKNLTGMGDFGVAHKIRY